MIHHPFETPTERARREAREKTAAAVVALINGLVPAHDAIAFVGYLLMAAIARRSKSSTPAIAQAEIGTLIAESIAGAVDVATGAGDHGVQIIITPPVTRIDS